MGINTVAVLFNDHAHEIEKAGHLGERIYRAMMGHDRSENLRGWFGAGKIISSAHADYQQVVIVGGNTGQSVQSAENVSYMALDAMAECLKRHGWMTKPPPKPKKRKVRT